MESTSVTACSTVTSMGSSTGEKPRRADYLQIDPSSTFINNSRNYDDLPENFLEQISPQQSSAPANSVMINDHSSSPQLAPLAPMSMASEQSSFGLMGLSSQYASIDKTSFGDSPAGLLSPLHMDSRRPHAGSDFGRSVFIKEEPDTLDNAHHMMMGPQMSLQQSDLDRMPQAETPPAVSNVELATTMIASLIGEQRNSSPSPHSYSGPPSSSMRIGNIKHDEDAVEGQLNGDDRDGAYPRQSYTPKPRRIYSTKDSNDPLNAEIDDDIYIDTKELCKRIAYELKQHSIPQAIFAERILCRSQGTLSDLLRNPKPWNKLKSGRETFRRMFNWVQQPLSMRLGILDMYKNGNENEDLVNGLSKSMGMTPPTPAQNVRHANRRSMDGDTPSNKRPRLVFTDIQKRTLQAIFKETQRPSREMQQTIAEHLRLDLSTVANFFMNARRRSRAGSNQDEPQPYQQVHPVTPPPESPPRTANNRNRRVPASMQHVEATVTSVAQSAIQYSRDAAAQDQLRLGDDDGYDDNKIYKTETDPVGSNPMYETNQDVHCEAPVRETPVVDVVDHSRIKQEEDIPEDNLP